MNDLSKGTLHMWKKIPRPSSGSTGEITSHMKAVAEPELVGPKLSLVVRLNFLYASCMIKVPIFMQAQAPSSAMSAVSRPPGSSVGGVGRATGRAERNWQYIVGTCIGQSGCRACRV